MRQALAGDAPNGSKRWRTRAVADWMAAQRSHPVAPQRGWDSLQRLKPTKHRQHVPQRRQALVDAEQQDTCK